MLLAVGLTFSSIVPAQAQILAPAPTPETTLTQPETDVLQEVELIGDRYGEASNMHHERMKSILAREYWQRQKDLESRYKSGLAEARSVLEKEHLDAVARMERFLRRYPNDAKWTPDVMFRLAELYLDQAGMDYERRELARMEGGFAEEEITAEIEDGDEGPAYDGPDYGRALGLWRDIVQRFPDYRQMDGTLYLLAFYYEQMGRSAESKQAFLGLVCPTKYNPLEVPPAATPEELKRRRAEAVARGTKNFEDPYKDCVARTDSGIVDEAWVRVGEIHFDAAGEIDSAIAAYRRVAVKKDSDYYNEALYKLAWSYYRNDQFMDSINSFDELVVAADKQEAETGKQALELRKEAIDYIAINFADPWEANEQPDPAKSLDRAFTYYKGRASERHVRDVFEILGDTLRAGEAHDQAIAAWRHSLDNWPLDARNPIVHQKIVDSMTLKGDVDGAMVERAKLAAAYRKGSPWFAANETNREAMENAQNLGEQSLLAAAKATHRRAQVLYKEWQDGGKPPAGRGLYLDTYANAAALYEEYLREYPTSKENYELTYRLADTYFFAEEFLKSVPNYRWVRDQRELGSEYFTVAALSIVQAYEQAIDKAKKEQKIAEPALPSPESLKQSTAALAIPELYLGLQQAYDEYMTLINDQKTAPKMALGSAMVSYRHLHLDDARKRFQIVMDRYCATTEAVQAKDGLLLIFQAQNDDAKFRATIDRFVAQGCGKDTDRDLAKKQKLSKEYEIASRLYETEDYLKAANAFYQLYKNAPADDENKDDALFSAAVAFKRGGRPKTAIAIYQEFTRDEKFRNSDYYVEALYRTAQSYQESFDSESAVKTYLNVVKLASERGRKTRPDFDMDQARLDSMWNAAVLREQDRFYYDKGSDPGAVTLYKRYAAAETKDRQRSRESYFRAGLVYEKANDTKNMVKAFADWRKIYGGDKDAGPFAVLSFSKSAKALERANDRKGTAEYFKSTIRAFDQYKIAPATPSAELAGEGQFWLAEQAYKASFEPYKVKWKGNITDRNEKKAEAAVKNTLDSLASVSKDAAKAYNDVARFQSSWSLAAIVRLGDIAFFAGQKLIEAPVPAEITKLDKQYPEMGVLDSYLTRIEEMVAPQTEDAKTNWIKAVDTARTAGVANDWSKLAQRRLNSYISSEEYPVQRDELIEQVEVP